MTSLLSLSDLHVSIDQTPILNGVSFTLNSGEIHALMGPNGSGKSSLAYTLMGHPRYEVTQGTLIFKGQSLLELQPHERARLGLFLAFQYPHEVEGVKFFDFLRQIYNARYGGTDQQLGPKAFRKLVSEKMELLSISPEFVERFLNYGFSGGEKKRAEMLQLAVLNPCLAILDEIDSGLDIDALKTVCETLIALRKANPSMTLLIITHYNRILRYLTPDVVHIMSGGIITQSGPAELAHSIEHEGYGKKSS